MWGTDSCLWGNPQWQIDAFRKFQIPDQLVEGYGYPKLTPEIKAKGLWPERGAPSGTSRPPPSAPGRGDAELTPRRGAEE